MASNNNSLNLGGPVWKPVPSDSNDRFAFTSRGSWTWPKTLAKGPDWSQNSGKGARKSVISQTSSAPVKWYDYTDPNGPTVEQTLSVAYDNYMAKEQGTEGQRKADQSKTRPRNQDKFARRPDAPPPEPALPPLEGEGPPPPALGGEQAPPPPRPVPQFSSFRPNADDLYRSQRRIRRSDPNPYDAVGLLDSSGLDMDRWRRQTGIDPAVTMSSWQTVLPDYLPNPLGHMTRVLVNRGYDPNTLGGDRGVGPDSVANFFTQELRDPYVASEPNIVQRLFNWFSGKIAGVDEQEAPSIVDTTLSDRRTSRKY